MPARQRHAHDHRDALALGLAEEQPRRPLAEDIVDDLDRGDARIFDRLQPLLDLLDADAVVADLAARDEVVEMAEHLRHVEHRGGGQCSWTRSSASTCSRFKLAPDPAGEVRLGVAFRLVGRAAAPALGRDERPRAAARLQHAADDLLRAPAAINVSRVDEGHAGVERRVQRRDRVALGDIAPATADRPGAEADFRNIAPEPRRVP